MKSLPVLRVLEERGEDRQSGLISAGQDYPAAEHRGGEASELWETGLVYEHIHLRDPVTDPKGHVIQEGKHLATVQEKLLEVSDSIGQIHIVRTAQMI